MKRKPYENELDARHGFDESGGLSQVPAPSAGSVFRTVEQPTRIDGDYLFFLRGYSAFGAEYGARLTRKEYERDLQNQAGAGRLIEKDGQFFFAQNVMHEPLSPADGGRGIASTRFSGLEDGKNAIEIN